MGINKEAIIVKILRIKAVLKHSKNLNRHERDIYKSELKRLQAFIV